MAPLLSVEGLVVDLPLRGPTGRMRHRIIDGVSFDVATGEAVGLVGESGSGKSLTLRSVVRLLPEGAEVRGSLRFADADVLTMSRKQLNTLRSSGVATIFQDPRAAVNPMRTVGDFVLEGPVRAGGRNRDEVLREALGLLADVGIDRPEQRLRQYPHELSGGMLQRIVIAAAILCRPRLLLADEPTTALDVTTQSDVIAILDEQRHERGLSMVFVTHDLDLAAAICDRTCVMYAGRIVEDQLSSTLHDAPRHPYTAALVAARPVLDIDAGLELPVLRAIRGRPASAYEAPSGCPFEPRCNHAEPECSAARPPEVISDCGRVACFRASELREILALEVEAHA